MTLFTGVKIMTEKKVAQVGPIEITKQENTPVYWSPLVGLLFVAVGGSILIYTRKKVIV